MQSMKKLKISVITPSYNSGNRIERAINSVMAQDYKYWEHIIVDGGSTDRTLAILKKYPHLNWISESDKGQADAMNKGYQRSTGDIIVYLNADDYFFNDAFSTVIKKFEDGANFVIGNVLVKSTRLGSEFINTPRITHVGMLHHWEPNSFCHNPVGYFYSREVQKNIPFNINNKYAMDLEFLIDASVQYKFQKVEKTLGCFEDRADTKTGLSQSKLDYWQRSNFPYIEKYLNKQTSQFQFNFFKEQINGYSELQKEMNKKNDSSIKFESAKEPLVSMIIPVHNESRLVIRAINSVLEQTYKNIELIIVDDASTNNTKNILNKYRSYKKIKVIWNKTNLGLAQTRNIGINESNGKYLFFLDADDWLEKESIQKLVSIAETYNADLVSCGIRKIVGNKIVPYHNFAFSNNGGIEGIMYLSDYKIASTAWNKLYLRKLIIKNKICFPNGYLHEDVIFSIKSVYYAHKHISIADEFYNYYQRKNSIINGKKSFSHLKSYVHLLVAINNLIRTLNLDKTDLDKLISLYLLKQHALVYFDNDLLCLKSNYISIEDWNNDLFNVCELEDSINKYVLFTLINKISSNNLNSQVSDIYTTKEKSLIFYYRKMKNIFIPERSKRKKMFDKIKHLIKIFLVKN